MSNTIYNGRSRIVAGAVVGLILAGWSLSSQAQISCTTENWSGVEGTVAVGLPSNNNRRYGGPCGARVQATADNFLVDDSPVGETTYNARFYAFLNALQGEALIFAALDDTTDVVQVWYNFPTSNDITLQIFPAAGGPTQLTVANVGTGWHSIELAWEAGPEADIRLKVNVDEDLAAQVDTSGLSITQAQLGVLNGSEASVTGTLDLDDFDSRRVSRPGRLLMGDANADGAINIFDIVAVRNEILGRSFALGQPDCTEAGAVNVFDIVCKRRLILGN